MAGYVIRKLRERLEVVSHPKKNDMILLLMECAGDELDEDCGTEMWMNMIDRGGLWHINDQTYSIFVIMEEEVRRFFALGSGSNKQVKPDVIRNNILQSNDLQFEWCLIASEADEETATMVLQKIVDLYVTIRGFAFAKSCLEQYKQAQKKTVRRKRALCSELCTKQ